jgi:6-phosphogluconolactonase (cycloisomerase 2 family)
MLRRLAVLGGGVATFVLLLGDVRPAGSIAPGLALPMLKGLEPAETCLMPPDAGYAASVAQRGGGNVISEDWPGANVPGGNIPPRAIVADPHPSYDGMGLDPQNGLVVMSDHNRHSILMYDLSAGGASPEITEPRRHIFGNRADIGHVAGISLDPVRREIWSVNNDGGGVKVFSYDAHGNTAPLRELTVPHQSWGLSLDLDRDEIAVTSQQYQGISIYARIARDADRPLRTIRGDKTMLADPHGVFMDGKTNEVFAANHGNWTEMRSYAAGIELDVSEYKPGRFEKPSIRVYPASANGDVPPMRTIQGDRTQLAWPMGIDVEGNELAVANYGTDSILIFARGANGNVGPERVIGGDRTGIVGPIAVQFDPKSREIWVANYGDHTAVVFDYQASGNVAPKRIVRNAPKGTPTTGFTNAAAAAYDTKRKQVLVPN